MPCNCGGKSNTLVQSLIAPHTYLKPGDSTEIAYWGVKPPGKTKYIMESGHAYVAIRYHDEVLIDRTDKPELLKRGLIDPDYKGSK